MSQNYAFLFPLNNKIILYIELFFPDMLNRKGVDAHVGGNDPLLILYTPIITTKFGAHCFCDHYRLLSMDTWSRNFGNYTFDFWSIYLKWRNLKILPIVPFLKATTVTVLPATIPLCPLQIPIHLVGMEDRVRFKLGDHLVVKEQGTSAIFQKHRTQLLMLEVNVIYIHILKLPA